LATDERRYAKLVASMATYAIDNSFESAARRLIAAVLA
jgi:hypothetical protein